MMPRMNGWEFIARVRGDAALASIPICTMSAVDGGLAGAQHTLRKPFGLADLVAIAARFAGDG